MSYIPACPRSGTGSSPPARRGWNALEFLVNGPITLFLLTRVRLAGYRDRHLDADGGPGWLNLLVLVFIWNALKFLVNGPVTLVLLVRARAAEQRARRAYEREMTHSAPSVEVARFTTSNA